MMTVHVQVEKEDAVMIPVILTLVALFEPRHGGVIRKRVLSTLPYWALLPVCLWVRMGLLGFDLPRKGVYRFGLDVVAAKAKLIHYGIWLFVNNWFLGPHLNGSCVAVWSLASGNIRRIR